jgi:uncharacterized membrane protein HdeD (DUF308 family)
MMDRDYKLALQFVIGLGAIFAAIGVLAYALDEKMMAYFFILLVGICLLVIGGLLISSANHQRKIHGRWR